MRSRLDLLAGAVVLVVLLLGVVTTVGPYATTGGDGMHDGSMHHGIVPVWNLFGAILVAAVIGGVYLLIRDDLHDTAGDTTSSATATEAATERETDRTSSPDDSDELATDEGEEASGDARANVDRRSTAADRQSAADVLRLLPDDERRVLEPVVDSPGITQIELRDRSEFSKSKVSQTVSELEKRGLLYRESQGRTYRVYPSEELSTER